MDRKLLKLSLQEMQEFQFIYNPASVDYTNSRSRQHYIDAFNIIAARVIEKNNEYFYINGKRMFINNYLPNKINI